MSFAAGPIATLVSFALGVTALAPSPSEADGAMNPTAPSLDDALRQEAYDGYVEGKQLFNRKRYLEAAGAFERSYAAVAVGRTLYALALSFEKSGDAVRALDAYQRYLDLPDCPAPHEHCAELRTEVAQTVSALEQRVGVLSVALDSGLDIRGIEIADRVIPVEDFPLVVDPGRFEVRILGRRRGEVRLQTIEVEPGQRVSLVVPKFSIPAEEPVLSLPPPSAHPQAASRASENQRRQRLRIAFYSGVGLTALAAAGMAIAGGLAWQAYSAQKDRCRGEGVSCEGTEYPAQDRERVERLVPVTNAFVGATVGLGITTAIVGIFAFKDRQRTKARGRARRVGPLPGGFAVRF